MIFLSQIVNNDTIKVLCVEPSKSYIECLLEPNTIIAIIAIFLSLIGFAFSVIYNRRTLRSSIKHNKLSVEPLLMHIYSTYDNQKVIQLNIHNCGLGPAIIKSFNIEFQNEKFDSIEKINSKYFSKINMELSFFTFDGNDVISPNSDLLIFKYILSNSEDFKMVDSIMEVTKITINYDTIYGDNKLYNTSLIPDKNACP